MHAIAAAVTDSHQFEAFGKRDVAAKQEEPSLSASFAAIKAATEHVATIAGNSNPLPASISSPFSLT